MGPLSVLTTIVLWFVEVLADLVEILAAPFEFAVVNGEFAEAAAFPPVLLTTAGYYGTLAAVRSLGRAGISVSVADADRLAVSKVSRFASERLRCPDIRAEGNRFINWVMSYGRKSAVKPVLLPTCDDTAWLYALHHEELSKHFIVDGSNTDVVYPLLNKRLLYERCVKLGIDTPKTTVIQSKGDLDGVAARGEFPVLIKPATQVFWRTRVKGEVCDNPQWFATRYMVHTKGNLPALLAFDPSASWPLVQEFFPDASDCIYNLAGYVDAKTGVTAFRASRKVLQVHRIGVGVCFEEAEVKDDLVDAVRALFKDVGYSGVFEVEFIQSGDRHLLIDANPRFYGEMAFEIGRGLPLPLLAYFHALGDREAVRALARGAADPLPHTPSAHTHGFGFEVVLNERWLSGAMSGDAVRAWRSWKGDPERTWTDAVYDADDPLPTVSDVAGYLYWRARYPVGFLRDLIKYRVTGSATSPLPKPRERSAESTRRIPLPPRDLRNRAS